MAWGHRPALDGLRAVAVYSVLLFHAGLSGVDGGFLGVGLFFVLSGFLVTSILLEEVDGTGTIALTRFYARRVRRLLPAALACIVAVSAFFTVVASTVARIPWIGDAQAALLYVVNWRFVLQADDYFAADPDRSPFLHFWSLSVEEQYYLAFPVLLLVLARLSRRWRPAVPVGLAVLLVASVLDQLVWAQVNPTHAYYGTDARLYELLAGGLAALAWRQRQRVLAVTADAGDGTGDVGGHRRTARTAVWEHPASGLVFLAAFVLLVSSALDLSPSNRDLLGAVAGVGLVLAASAERGRLLHRFLAQPTMTYLGRISYGTYLWHWPVIVLLHEVLDSRALVVAAVATGLATGLAALSYEVLEQPIRRARSLNPFSTPVVLSGLTASVAIALLVVPSLLGQNRIPDLAVAADAAPVPHRTDDRPVPAGIDWRAYAAERGSGNDFCTPADLESCLSSRGTSGLRVGLIGDSHAREFAVALTRLGKEHDFTVALNVLGGCSWQLGVVSSEAVDRGTDGCKRSREALYSSMIRDLHLDVVLLVQSARDAGRWEHDLSAADGSHEPLNQLNLRTMTDTVQRIRAEGAKVVIMESFLRPEDSGVEDVLSCLSAARRVSQCRVPAPKRPPVSDGMYDTIALTQPDTATTNINDIMCPAWPVCEAMFGRTPVWRDGKHYSARALLLKRSEIWDRLRSTGYFGGAD